MEKVWLIDLKNRLVRIEGKYKNSFSVNHRNTTTPSNHECY